MFCYAPNDSLPLSEKKEQRSLLRDRGISPEAYGFSSFEEANTVVEEIFDRTGILLQVTEYSPIGKF